MGCIVVLILVAWLVGCHAPDVSGGAPEDGVDPLDPAEVPDGATPEGSAATFVGRTRSGEAVPAGHHDGLLALDRDAGALLELPGVDGEVRTSPLGAEPTRMIRDGADLFVTLRADGAIVHLRHDGRAWGEVARAAIGAEPYDVGLSPDGAVVYASLSMEDAVVALDRATLAEVGRWTIGGEPRWLAVDAGGLVFVASAQGGILWTIDPAADRVDRRPLPNVRRSSEQACRSSYLRPRVTAEIVVDEDFVYVPALYADTDLRSLAPVEPAELDLPANTYDDDGYLPFPVDDDEGLPWCPRVDTPVTVEVSNPYGPPTEVGLASSVSRFNPALILVPRDGGVAVATALSSGARLDPRDGQSARVEVARSYPSALEVVGAPEGGRWRAFVSMEAMGVVVAVDLSRPTQEPLTGGFVTHARSTATTAAGPVAVRAIDQTYPAILVWSWLDRVSAEIPLEDVDAGDRGGSLGAASNQFGAPPSPLAAEVLRGRELFYRSDLAVMTGGGSGVSCSACHTDVRTDGNTWLFDDFARQTPSLAGDAGRTAPVTWLGDVPSIAVEAELTTVNRMGGRGVTPEDYAAIEAFVRSVRPVSRPAPADPALVAEGREVFQRPEVGCATCHAGALGTSNANVSLYGYPELNVPTLRGIAATAPYLHDGSALTLRDVIERSRDGSMGDTSSLSDHEMDALEAFLRQF
ncbi:MAG TPA: c-type cytochrome [Myxococcota bacterium]|nr:c-type cytochrome [Myxococcota bacterium]